MSSDGLKTLCHFDQLFKRFLEIAPVQIHNYRIVQQRNLKPHYRLHMNIRNHLLILNILIQTNG